MGQSSSQETPPWAEEQERRRRHLLQQNQNQNQVFSTNPRPMAGGGRNRTQQRPAQAQPRKSSPPKTDNKENTPFTQPPISRQNLSLIKSLEDRAKGALNGTRRELQAGSVHTYESLFAEYMDNQLTAIKIADPYIMKTHQMHNFLRFLEVCVLNCPALKVVKLSTQKSDNPEEQQEFFNDMKRSLNKRNIYLLVEFNVIHDRKIL